MLLGVGASEFSLLLILLLVVVVPIAGIAFSRSGKGLEELGKGRFAVDFDQTDSSAPDDQDREDEIRQMAEAMAWRHRTRGHDPAHTEAEIEALLSIDSGPEADLQPDPPAEPPPESADGELDQIREEIRQVVIANNERRERRGEAPLEIEAEVERRLKDLLG